MALIPTQLVVVAGTEPEFTAAAAGDTASVGDGYKLIVQNDSESSINVTIAVPGKQVSGASNDPVVTPVAAGAGGWIPLSDYYANPTDKKAHISYSATADVTRAVVKG